MPLDNLYQFEVPDAAQRRLLASRLDAITQETRDTWTRVKRDVEATKRLLVEARDCCRVLGKNFDKMCKSGVFGFGKTQAYRLLDGKTSGSVPLGDVLHDFPGDCGRGKSGLRYQAAPPDLLNWIYQTFQITDDVCPNPRPVIDGVLYNGLTAQWGRRPYANPPFDESYRWVKKALAEIATGKVELAAIILPSYQQKACAMLVAADADRIDLGLVQWRALEDGSPDPTPIIGRSLCDLYILRPGQFQNEKIYQPASTRGRWSKMLPDLGETRERSSHTEWWTPQEFYRAMDVEFDCDPCSPGKHIIPWSPARLHLTESDDGLTADWHDYFVFLNPPYGLRFDVNEWIEKFIAHRNGVALLPDFTSTDWWHRATANADLIMFVQPKINFINGRPHDDKPRTNTLGSTVVALGERGMHALRNAERNGRGLCFQRDNFIHERNIATS